MDNNEQVIITINTFLVWLGGGGCVIAASWILERWEKYKELASNTKMLIFFGLASALGIGSYLVGAYVPQETIAAIAPYFLIVASVFSYVFLGTAFHRVDKQDRTVEVELTDKTIKSLEK